MGGVTDQREASARPRILIIVQNLPVPFDRRVWLESKALTAAGYDVTVICPKGKGDPELRSTRRRDAAEVPSLRTRGWGARLRPGVRVLVPGDCHTGAARSSRRASSTCCRRATRRTSSGPSPSGFVAETARGSSSTTTISAPSSTIHAFPQGSAVARRGLLSMEKATFRTADHVVSTNASYAEIALRRGGKVQR